VLSLIIGLYALRHVFITLLALALLLGIFWTVNGAVELFTALSHSEVPHRAWLIFMGILSIIAGIILLAYPGISLLVLYVIVGVWLLVFGFMEISIAWQMRSASHRTSGREAHAT
jgi:uncharacterized membrane protein HdeD (DUF308 family)